MISRKRLQLLLYVLRIFYVVGEADANDLSREEGTENPTRISSFDYNYATITEKAEEYIEQTTRNFPEFPDITTDSLDSENELQYDYPKYSSTDESNTDNTTDNSIRESNDTLLFPDEIDNRIIPDISENDSSTCDLLWGNNTEGLGEVQNLTATFIGIDWISLSWYPPCNDVTNVSYIYLIKTCRDSDCIETIENSTSYNATNLPPCTQHTFIVKAIHEYEETAEVQISASTDNVAEIGMVENLQVNYVHTDEIHLTWDAPKTYPTCIRNYSITQCFEDDCNEFAVTKTEYLAKYLKPCREYLFSVATVAENVQSPGQNITKKTSSPKLGKPLSPKVESGNFSLRIYWQPPKLGGTCIKQYRVTVSPDAVTETPRSTEITIHGRNACTIYTVYLLTVNEDNSDGDMVILTKEALPVATKPPVLTIPQPSAKLNSAWFTWNIDMKRNNCSLLSVVTLCNYTSTNGRGFTPHDGEGVIHVNSHITEDFIIVNATVDNLSPYTTYTCYAYTTNEGGYSASSEPVNVTTLEDVPSAPVLNTEIITDSLFILVWESPHYLAGNLEDFEIVLTWETLFPIPDWCSVESFQKVLYLNGTVFHYEYLDARPFTRYVAKMRARTSAGWGAYSLPLLFETKPQVPGMISKFVHSTEASANDSNVLDTVLTWALPCSSNGEIKSFNVSVYGSRNGHIPHDYSIEKYIDNPVRKNDMFSINLEELKGEYNYTFKVSAKVEGVDDYGVEAVHSNILYPAGIPPQPDEEYIRSITIDPYKARRSTTSASVLLPLFPNTNGDIMYYSIIISEVGHNPSSMTRFDLKNNVWPNISSWEESMKEDFAIPYQATRPHWDPYPNYVADYGHMKAVKFVLGEDTTCKEISSNTNKRLYCNGPLKPDTWYHVRMRAFTFGGYTDSIAFVIKTNAELNVGIVVGIVFGILLLGTLTTMMLLVRKCSPYVVIRRFLHSDMSGSPVPAPFTRKKFIAHCQQLVDNPGKISNEFRLLQTLSVDLQMPTNTACLQANKKKNRYSDILPYDFSRVKLEVIDNDPNTDYINASFIRGYTGEDEYIACQGPKEETTYDFWRMVDQYNINIIVMLTQLVEKGKEKCHQYFPTIRETFRYENMTIRCTSELDFRTYTQRTLVLQKENKKRCIMHLHFKDWPDHDVPEDFDAMINFCQIMRRNILANKGFAVIHCSAGIGRTGTLIAIDILLQHLRENRKLDVFGTVYRLRHHRINMVQRESQYAYIYNCIKQVLKNPYCLKTYKPPPVDPIYENISKTTKNVSNSNANLVNSLETLKKRNFFMSMDSIGPLYDILPWPNRKPRTSTINNGLRYCKSVNAIDWRACQSTLGESDSLDCLIYEAVQSSTSKSKDENSNKSTEKESDTSLYENLEETVDQDKPES